MLNLRGGLDGLSACIPLFEGAALSAQRPDLLVPTGPGSGAVNLDGSFALHPSLAPLEACYRDGELALVHATGSLDPTRSHFAARRAIDAGAIGSLVPGAEGGWIGRALAEVPESSAIAPRGVALGPVLPLALAKGPRVVPVGDPRSFSSYGNTANAGRRRAALAAMSSGAGGGSATGTARHAVGLAGMATVGTLESFDSIDFDRSPSAAAVYPSTQLGRRLFDAATLVRSGVGVDVIHIDHGDWDDHDDMGPLGGDLAARLDDLGRAIAAFRTDLGGALARTTLLVHSEFGRRVDQNGSGGTDHGRGGLAMVLGGGVQGGRVIADWPGLAPGSLDDGALAVTTDLRDVMAEILRLRLGIWNIGGVFPGLAPRAVGAVG